MGLRIIIVCLFLCVAFNGVAQKCYYEKNEVDAITEMVVKRTEPVQVAVVNDRPLYVKAQCIGQNKYLKMRYYRYSGFTINEMLPVEFIFTDSTRLSLTARDIPDNNTTTGGFVKVSSLLIFNLDSDGFRQLMDKPVSKITFYAEDIGLIEKSIREKHQGEIQYIMKCILLDSDSF